MQRREFLKAGAGLTVGYAAVGLKSFGQNKTAESKPIKLPVVAHLIIAQMLLLFLQMTKGMQMLRAMAPRILKLPI